MRVKPGLKQISRALRKQQTLEEIKLWRLLRSRRFLDFKFRRQFVIDKYIVDFCCLKRRLILELDGGQHSQSQADIIRDSYLSKQGFNILRIWNNDLNQNQESVLDKIYQVLKQ